MTVAPVCTEALLSFIVAVARTVTCLVVEFAPIRSVPREVTKNRRLTFGAT